MLAVLCALGSSLLYALASVLQHRGAVAQPDEQSMKPGLLLRLAADPWWLLGLVCDGGGYVLQFLALGHGALVVVQPLLVCGLLFALPLGAALSGRRLGRGDWTAALLVCVGLGAFLTVADPASGRPDTTTTHWIVLLVLVSCAASALTAGSRRGSPRSRAVLLAAAAGVLYGAAAALTKTTAHLLSRGVLPMLGHWQPYLLVAFGAIGMLMAQSAFQAEVLDASLPTMTVVDPIVSIVIGASLFGEAVAASPAAITAEVLGLLAMAAGVYQLGRSEAGSRRSAARAEEPVGSPPQ